jgi:hypothetical protein
VSFVATFVLVFILIVRPQEIWPALAAFRLLDVFTGLAALGVVVDFAMGKQRQVLSPQLPFLGAFVAITYVSSIVMLGSKDGITQATTNATLAAVFMLVVMFGARTLPRFRTLVGLLVALAMFVSVVAIHQGQQDPVCLELPADSGSLDDTGTPDGRACETRHDCEKGGRTDVEYECERTGWFDTVSVERRVRYRGQLGDPNELSVYIGAVLPLLFALTSATKRWYAWALAAVCLAIGLYAVILTQSRGGQLVIGSVFAAYFISRYGWKGILAGVVFALPVLLLGGRAGEHAEASAEERTGLMYDAVTAALRHPIFGMGIHSFVEEAGHTTHNAYLLAAVDLGIPGFYFWSGLLWTSVKIPLTLVRHPPEDLDPRIKELATALLVSWIGMLVGIFFLSFTYKQLFFVWLGTCGALYGAVKNDHPKFEVKLAPSDFVIPGVFCLVILAATFVYTRLNPA